MISIQLTKKKKIFIKLMSITLALATVVTSIPPTQIYGETETGTDSDVLDSADNQEEGKTDSNSTDNILAYFRQTQGYRIYLINQDLVRITQVYDFANQHPRDSAYSWWAGGDDYDYEKTTRFDKAGISPVTPKGYNEYLLSDLKSFCNASEDVPLPALKNDKHEGNGLAFKQWFTAGQDLSAGNSVPEFGDTTGTEGTKSEKVTGSTPTNTPTPTSTNNPTNNLTPTVCSLCQGKGTLSCPECKGDGLDDTMVMCDKCEGFGKLTCLCQPTKENGTDDSETEETSTCQTCRNTITNHICSYGHTYEIGCPVHAGIELLADGYCSLCDKYYTFVRCLGCSTPFKTAEHTDIGNYCNSCKSLQTSLDSAIFNYENTKELSDENYELFEYIQDKTGVNKAFNEAAIQYLNYYKFYEAQGLTSDNCKMLAYSACKSHIMGNTLLYNRFKIINTGYIYTQPTELVDLMCKIYVEYFRIKSSGYTFNEIEEPYSKIFYFRNRPPILTSANIINSIGLLNTDIPLSGEENTSSVIPAKEILTHPDMFQTVVGYEPELDEHGNIKKTAAEVAVADGCLLIVEPLTGMYAQTKNGNSYEPANYTDNRIYGTYWNIMSHWGADGYSDFYDTFISSLYPYCLCTGSKITTKTITDSDGNTIGGKTIYAVTDTSLINPMKKAFERMGANPDSRIEGLSMHVYDFVRNDKTQTYDTDLKDVIGASPNDTYKVQEKLLETDRYATIVKFYETVNPVTGEIITSTTFTRDKVPLTVKFLHEDGEGETGFYIADWFTSNERDLDVPSDAVFLDYKETVEVNRQGVYQEGHEHGFKISDEGVTLRVKPNTPDGDNSKECTLYVLLRENTKVTATSTYDEPLGPTPGPSPDDTDLLTEEQLTQGFYANIVKFYETIDDNTRTPITTQVFVREQVPRLIQIESEPDTGYEITNWFISDEYIEGLDAEDSDISYNSILDYLNVLQQSEEVPEEPVDVTGGNEELTVVTLYIQLQRTANLAETSTYDESLGEEIGPSPDDTGLLTEEQQSDSTQYANIVKFYEEIDSKTFERNDENSFIFARKIVPQIIEIEDETDTTGYKVVEWFTSERYIAPTDGKYYEDYKDKLSIFNIGTDTGTIKFIDEEGKHTGETTLYVLLQKETTPEKKKLPITSTYDEELGNQPGAAPDDSNLLKNEEE